MDDCLSCGLRQVTVLAGATFVAYAQLFLALLHQWDELLVFAAVGLIFP
jgi:hypothetical protein